MSSRHNATIWRGDETDRKEGDGPHKEGPREEGKEPDEHKWGVIVEIEKVIMCPDKTRN